MTALPTARPRIIALAVLALAAIAAVIYLDARYDARLASAPFVVVTLALAFVAATLATRLVGRDNIMRIGTLGLSVWLLTAIFGLSNVWFWLLALPSAGAFAASLAAARE